MTKSPTTLLRFVALLVLGACGRGWAADDGSPQLLEQPAEAEQAPCPCGCHQDTAAPTCPNGQCGSTQTGRMYGGRHSLVGGRGGAGRVEQVPGSLQRRDGTLHNGQHALGPYAHADMVAANRAAAMSWHAGYYNTQYGAPVALVVPPTARMSTRWGWGVSQSTMSPIYPQFERAYPGPVMVDPVTGQGPMPLQSTPRWPSHTDQFGVYYIRGPW